MMALPSAMDICKGVPSTCSLLLRDVFQIGPLSFGDTDSVEGSRAVGDPRHARGGCFKHLVHCVIS